MLQTLKLNNENRKNKEIQRLVGLTQNNVYKIKQPSLMTKNIKNYRFTKKERLVGLTLWVGGE
jgi:hypothetical protein